MTPIKQRIAYEQGEWSVGGMRQSGEHAEVFDLWSPATDKRRQCLCVCAVCGRTWNEGEGAPECSVKCGDVLRSLDSLSAVYPYHGTFTQAAAVIRQLIAERDALRRDSERLRDRGGIEDALRKVYYRLSAMARNSAEANTITTTIDNVARELGGDS